MKDKTTEKFISYALRSIGALWLFPVCLTPLQSIPVLFLNGEGGYHRVYDHCVAKWLNQAGVETR